MSNSFGNVPHDAAFSNTQVSSTLVAGTSVSNKVVTNELVANKLETDVLSIRGEEITVSAKEINEVVGSGGSGGSSGSGGGGGTVPGSVNQILTSNGSGQIVAPGSTVTNTGILNIVSATADLPKIEFNGATFIENNPTKQSLSIGTNTQGVTGLFNTVVGENATVSGNTNVAIGTTATIAAGAQGSVVIGFASRVTNPAPESISIGNNASVNTTNDVDGSIVIGKSAAATGNRTGAIHSGSICIGESALDITANGAGSVVIGNHNSTQFANCVCLGNNAASPTIAGQLTLPAALDISGSWNPAASATGYIRLKLASNGNELRIPYYYVP